MVDRDVDGLWRVYLPHSCDEWIISGFNYNGVPLDEAIRQLKEFLEEGEAALELLYRGETTC